MVLGALALGLAAACRPETPETETATLAPELKLERVRFRAWRGAELRTRGEARQVTLRRDSSQLTAVDLRAELPRAEQLVVIEAPAGEGVLSARTFTAHGGVVITRGDDQARTERARYAPGEGGAERVTGDDPVELERRGGFRLFGVGFVFDPQTSELDLGGPVRVRSERGSR
jgi:lipopolysaccharide export system protein LptC